jgi:hypothetical protein
MRLAVLLKELVQQVALCVHFDFVVLVLAQRVPDGVLQFMAERRITSRPAAPGSRLAGRSGVGLAQAQAP